MPVPVTLLVAANQLILITAFFMLVLFKATICCLFQCDRREKKGIRSAENHYACHHEGELLPAFFMKFPSYVSSDSFIHFRSGLSLPTFYSFRSIVFLPTFVFVPFQFISFGFFYLIQFKYMKSESLHQY